MGWFLYIGINGKERTLYILLQLKSSLTPTGTGSHDHRLVGEKCFHYCEVSYRMTNSHLFDFVTNLASWKYTSITCITSGMCYARHVQIKPRNHTKSLHTHMATIWFWNRGQGENTTESFLVVILTFAECTTTTVNHQLMTLGLSLMKLSTNTASKLAIYRSEGTERAKEKRGKKVGQLGARKTSTTNTPWSY